MSMIIKKGFLEILQFAAENTPRNFNDFTKIPIAGRLSSTTVAKRLKELIAVKALEEVVSRSKSGKRVIAYKTTEKGKKVIVLAKVLQTTVAQ